MTGPEIFHDDADSSKKQFRDCILNAIVGRQENFGYEQLWQIRATVRKKWFAYISLFISRLFNPTYCKLHVSSKWNGLLGSLWCLFTRAIVNSFN